MDKKKSKKRRQMANGQSGVVENREISVEELALALLENPRIRQLIHPYMITMETDQQVAFLKIIAVLLLFDDDEEIAEFSDDALGDNAPFVRMFARAIDEIIAEEVAEMV